MQESEIRFGLHNFNQSLPGLHILPETPQLSKPNDLFHEVYVACHIKTSICLAFSQYVKHFATLTPFSNPLGNSYCYFSTFKNKRSEKNKEIK